MVHSKNGEKVRWPSTGSRIRRFLEVDSSIAQDIREAEMGGARAVLMVGRHSGVAEQNREYVTRLYEKRSRVAAIIEKLRSRVG